jgi:hypothetical protein
VRVPKMDFTNQDIGDRQSDYAVENNQAAQSRLLDKKEILTYANRYSATTSTTTTESPKPPS